MLLAFFHSIYFFPFIHPPPQPPLLVCLSILLSWKGCIVLVLSLEQQQQQRAKNTTIIILAFFCVIIARRLSFPSVWSWLDRVVSSVWQKALWVSAQQEERSFKREKWHGIHIPHISASCCCRMRKGYKCWLPLSSSVQFNCRPLQH